MYSLIVTLIVIYISFVDKVKTAPLDPNALNPGKKKISRVNRINNL